MLGSRSMANFCIFLIYGKYEVTNAKQITNLWQNVVFSKSMADL